MWSLQMGCTKQSSYPATETIHLFVTCHVLGALLADWGLLSLTLQGLTPFAPGFVWDSSC